MSEENEGIILSPLFPRALYAPDEFEPAVFVNFEGKESLQAKLLFLLNDKESEGIRATDLELLKKLADWLGVGRSEVVVFNIADQPVSFREIYYNHGVQNIICYGITPNQVGLQLDYQNNRIIRFMNCKIIFTAPFQEVQKNEKLKKEFFDEVSKLFDRTKQKKS